MTIALDYDGTYDRDPGFWGRFIIDAEREGHTVVIVTARPEQMPVERNGHQVYYTNGALKRQWCQSRGLQIDVWIDDMPEMI